MMETILSFMLIEHMWHGILGEPEKGLGYPRMLTPHRRPYRTKDGYISVIAHSDAQWGKLFEAMGVPHLISDPRFATVSARVCQYRCAVRDIDRGDAEAHHRGMAGGTAAGGHSVRRCQHTGQPVHRSIPERNGFFPGGGSPDRGTVVVPAIPARFSESSPNVQRLWPTLGEHTQEILRGIGCTDAEIDDIMAE